MKIIAFIKHISVIIILSGSTGNFVTLKANFFPIVDAASMSIYKYAVKLTPHVPPQDPVFKAVLNSCRDALGSFVLHEQQLFCSKQLFGNVM